MKLPLISLFIFSIASANSADDWLGHETYFRATMVDPSSPPSQVNVAIDRMMNRDKAVVVNADSRAKRESLKRVQLELADLNRQLGRSLLKQDAVLVIAFSGAALFSTSLIGRVGLESSERLIGAAEYAVPDRKALGWANKSLLGTKGFLDRMGRAASRVTFLSGVLGSVGTIYLFYCEREDVRNLAGAVATSLAEVEKMIAAIDFVEKPAK